MRVKKIIFIFFCIFSWLLTVRPVLAVSNDLGLWTPIWITQPINKRFSTLLEISPRNQENVTHINQLFIRPAVEYKLNKNLSFWQGYSWDPLFLPIYKREQRIWQQILLENYFKKFRFENRIRLEERFIQDVHGVPVRFRYRTGTWTPIDKNGIWKLVLWDEIWFNMGNHFNGPQSGFDRNWLFAGINKKISDNVSLEVGYQLEYANRTSPRQDLLNHIIVINTYFNLPQLFK